MRWALLALLVAAALPAAQSVRTEREGGGGGSFGSCTDGSDCLCDQTGYIVGQPAISGGGTVRYCQDFDDLSWDDGTGDAAFLAGFTEPASFNCPSDKGTQNSVDEGTDDNDCFDMVQEPGCGLAGTSDCAFGNQAFGARMVQGHTHGIAAKPTWTGTSTEFGITMAMKWSENFNFDNTAGFKTIELLHGSSGNTNGYPFGQGISMNVGSFSPEKFPTGYASEVTADLDPRGFATRTNFTGDCTSSGEITNVTITKGLIACDGGLTYWTAFETDYEDNDGSFPVGRWGCMRCHGTGLGTTNQGLQCWWKDETDTAESEIINFTGYDGTTAEIGLPVIGVAFNPYFNGVQAGGACTDGLTESTSGGYGSTGCNPPNFTYNPASLLAYRYEDNLVVTDGAPVTCAEIGL